MNRVELGAARQALHHGLFTPAMRPVRSPSVAATSRDGRERRVGVIHNARARHNIGRHLPLVIAGCDHVLPRTHEELRAVLANFVANGIDALIIDGGDGTVRDVVSAILRYFPGFLPRIAVVPSGKTNALALDLGIPLDWTLGQALDAVIGGRIEQRTPIEVCRDGSDHAELSGFIFGVGAYVRATQTAQKAHRFGAFNGLAVGLSIAAAVAQTILGGADNPWRRGAVMKVATGTDVVEGPQYLILASTLGRLPLGIKPFGPPRLGLKMLRIEAPVRRLVQALPAILAGTDRAWLSAAGYHRQDVGRIDLSLAGGFVLDGETFDGGDLSLRQGAPMSFVVP